jgi:hypothetical protein
LIFDRVFTYLSQGSQRLSENYFIRQDQQDLMNSKGPKEQAAIKAVLYRSMVLAEISFGRRPARLA